MKSQNFKEYPKGCGQMSCGKKNDKAIDLDLLIAFGNRAQRRFAKRELKALKKSRSE
jgi:hypothetical protein